MAKVEKEMVSRYKELDDVRLRVNEDHVFQIEFSVNELVKKLVPDGSLASYCSGCHGCSGCSM